MSEKRGLRVVGGGELILRAVPAKAGKRSVEHVVSFLERQPRLGIRLRKVAPHTDVLRALTRKQQSYQRSTADPQVNPAPNATRSTLSPGLTRPASTASSSA